MIQQRKNQIGGFTMIKQYKIYDLGNEYKNFVGINSTAVVSNMTEDQLLYTYPELKDKIPFILLTEKQWEQISLGFLEFNKNEEKHRKRGERHGDAFGYRDGETELFIKSLDSSDTVLFQVIDNIEKEKLHKAFGLLSESQRRRIYLYYFNHLTYRQIAEIESVSDMSIRESINGGLKKIKNILKNTPLK